MSNTCDPMAKLLTRLRSRTRISLVIFGAVMIHLTIGTYHTFGNMLPYMASYMNNFTDKSVKIEHLIWIPTFQGCFPFAMIIGGFLARRFGPRIAAGIGCYTMCASVFLSGWAIQHSYYAFLLTYGLMFGLGQGIAYVVAVSCVINWAPKMVGLGSGIVAAGFGISSSIFAPIQNYKSSQCRPNNILNFFPKYRSRVPGIFTTLSIVFFIMQCIGLIFICDPPTEFARRFLVHDCTSLIDMAWLSKRRSHWLASNGPPLLSSGWAQAKLGLTRVEQFGRYQYSKLSADDSDEQKNIVPDKLTDLEHSLKEEGNLTNSFPTPPNESADSDELEIEKQGLPISFNPYQMLQSSTFTFGETFIDDDFFLAMAFSLGSIANAIARVGWGLLTDRTSFQTSLCMATSLATVLLLTMPLTALAGRYVYLLWLILMFVCLAATHALFITAIVRCFGSQHKIINYGFLILSTSLSGIVLAIGSEYFLHSIGYNWAFILTACFPFIAFLLTSAIRITPQGHLIVSK
uniref:Major facilitator superfamily (MFS) profile domain-containing protein n=1 Tax=Meloidogyne floridensis TaxID=298350 RepID=A0A915P856_9BILA